MRNKAKFFFLSVVLISLVITTASCLSNPSRHYYQLNADNQQNRYSVVSEKSLAISRIEIDDFYDSYRIAYRDSKYEINRYLYHLWYKKPSFMIRDILASYFRSNRLFARTFSRLDEGDPDYILNCRVICLEEYFEGKNVWAHLAMDIRIKDVKSGALLLAHQFDRREPALGPLLVDLVKTMSVVLGEELNAFSAQIASRLSTSNT